MVKRVKVAEIGNRKGTGEGTAKKGKETGNTECQKFDVVHCNLTELTTKSASVSP